MYRLESKRIKREFKITNGNFYASQIVNKYSGMSFVPDGNGSEFVIRFTDGSSFSAKGLTVVDTAVDNGRLSFTFEECMGVTVKLEYWLHKDENTICKQLTLSQSDDKVIDFILLEYVGIINSESHFGCEVTEDSEIPQEWAVLGQPYYIDSLFYGCEFPAADCRIVHGMGRVKYFLGKSVGMNYACPVTVMGAAKDNTLAETKKAFFEYLDSIRCPLPLTYHYNNWFNTMGKMNEASVKAEFDEVHQAAAQYGIDIKNYVIDDGWCDYKGSFWNISKKLFPQQFESIGAQCRDYGAGLGLWLSPRGGYSKAKNFAKKVQRAHNGYYNDFSEDICVASRVYLKKLEEFLIETVNEQQLSFLKLDGFWHKPCRNASHDHMTGGRDDMYLVTDMTEKWVKLLKNLRKSANNGDALVISLTCFINPSPFWLQWANAIWLQNSEDIGFARIADGEGKLDQEITYRDARYYDMLCRRAVQLPADAIFNHEPIYATGAKVKYNDAEFEKYVYWNIIRGSALNELYISAEMLNESKWTALADAIRFQKENFDILKNTVFIGGNPEENNVYGYIGWDGESGIIALRNPDGERAPLTLTLNKLMGAPETLKDATIEKIYCSADINTDGVYGYNDKIDFELDGFDTAILKISKSV